MTNIAMILNIICGVVEKSAHKLLDVNVAETLPPPSPPRRGSRHLSLTLSATMTSSDDDD